MVVIVDELPGTSEEIDAAIQRALFGAVPVLEDRPSYSDSEAGAIFVVRRMEDLGFSHLRSIVQVSYPEAGTRGVSTQGVSFQKDGREWTVTTNSTVSRAKATCISALMALGYSISFQ